MINPGFLRIVTFKVLWTSERIMKNFVCLFVFVISLMFEKLITVYWVFCMMAEIAGRLRGALTFYFTWSALYCILL